MCAYVGYKGTDDLSLLVRDVTGKSEVDAAWVGTAAFWIRPFAAVGAGLLADRVGGWRTVAACFVLLLLSNLGVATASSAPVVPLLFASVAGTCVAVYALRGVYFALFPEAGVPVAVTGTAVGLVSVVGYTPDVFFGPLMGAILDAHSGAEGHRVLFFVLAGFACAGVFATLGFAFAAGGHRRSAGPSAESLP